MSAAIHRHSPFSHGDQHNDLAIGDKLQIGNVRSARKYLFDVTVSP